MRKLNLILISLVLIIVTSCKNNNDDEITPVKNINISGQWEFILSSDEVVADTTHAHGYTGADFSESASVNEEVYLYENSNGEITGFCGPFKLTGNINGSQVTLNVFINPDGDVDPVLPVENMVLFSKLSLKIDAYGFMSGTGTYEAYAEFPAIENETYDVHARMLSAIRNNNITKNTEEISHWYDFICNEIEKLVDWSVEKYTDGKVRPMSGCSLHKDGGGYYVLGHEGPGDRYEYFSTTLYYPHEWCRCKSRSYGFEVSLKEKIMSIDHLVEILQSDEIKEIAKKLGFDLPDALFFAVEEFYNQFGDFAISIGYSDNTHNASIYVNHEHGSSTDVLNNILIKKIKSAVDKEASEVWVFAGNSIKDKFQLKRSFYGIHCSTPLIFTYLIGTFSVNYN